MQLSIAWALRLPAISCVLVGAKTADQVREQAVAATITLSDDELKMISQILATAPES